MLTKFALAQMAVIPGKLEKNFSRGIEMIQSAVNAKNHYVLFPELWTSGYPVAAPAKTARANVEFIKVLRDLSLKEKTVMGGSFLLEEDHNFYNRYVLITPDGEQPIVYDKIHLFKPLKEDQVLASGKNLSVKTYREAVVGLSICYDLRFPELFRVYSAKKVNLFLLAAEWPLSRIAHWKILVQARAIENQSFFAAVNCVGKTATDIFGGSSMLVDPYGNILCSGNETDECLLFIDCDLSDAETYRKNFRVLESQRKEIFHGD